MHFYSALLWKKLLYFYKKTECTIIKSETNFTIVRSLLQNSMQIGTFATKGAP